MDTPKGKTRKDYAFRIGGVVKPGVNTIACVQTELSCTYLSVAGIYLVKNFSDYDIINHSMEVNKIPFKKSLDEICGLLSSNATDDDVQLHIPQYHFLEIKISCPILYKQMKIPAKGENCAHTECFSLDNFLAINRSNQKLNCPICQKKALNPRYDELMSCILNKVSKDTQVRKII